MPNVRVHNKTVPSAKTYSQRNRFKAEEEIRGIKTLNRIFGLIFAVIFIVNTFFIYSYAVHGKTPTQAVVGLAGTSLEVLDSVWKPQLKKTDNYTGFLIMGIDSKQLDFNGKEFNGSERNIDTIMQVVYNHDSGDLFMISLPRDTGITAEDNCIDQTVHYSHSINYIYKEAIDGGCPMPGHYYMQKYVTYVTGFDNHYFAIVSFEAFRDIVETVGDSVNGKKGLYIDVPRDLREYYPREKGGGYEPVFFKKGYQFIDSTQLLKYARSRQATSDFDRARRQQQVVDAVKNKVLNNDTLLNPGKLYELYQTFTRNSLFSEFTLDDIAAGVDLMRNFENGKVHNIVLDDQFGGNNSYLTKPITSSGGTHRRPHYYLSPVAYNSPECTQAKDEYCKVKQRLKLILDNPDMIAEDAKIFAYANVAGTPVTNAGFDNGKTKFLGNITNSRLALPGREGWGEVQIYDFSGGKYDRTKRALENSFSTVVRDGSTAAFKSPPNKEDFVIIVKVN